MICLYRTACAGFSGKCCREGGSAKLHTKSASCSDGKLYGYAYAVDIPQETGLNQGQETQSLVSKALKKQQNFVIFKLAFFALTLNLLFQQVSFEAQHQ